MSANSDEPKPAPRPEPKSLGYHGDRLVAAGQELVAAIRAALAEGRAIGGSPFSPRAAEQLTAAGWKSNRWSSNDYYEVLLESGGYWTPLNVRDFLARYGGLTLVDEPSHTEIDLNPYHVQNDWPDESRRAEIEKRIGAYFCPIGMLDWCWLLFLDEQGRFFAQALDDRGRDCAVVDQNVLVTQLGQQSHDTLYLLAHDEYEFFNRMCERTSELLPVLEAYAR